jgi:LysR family transcriptional regulator for bpeEF and oprC
MPISAVYPHNRHLSPKVRVFVDFIAELFERCPLLQGLDETAGECKPTVAAEGADARWASYGTEMAPQDVVV